VIGVYFLSAIARLGLDLKEQDPFNTCWNLLRMCKRFSCSLDSFLLFLWMHSPLLILYCYSNKLP
jgi:hypothetical protein